MFESGNDILLEIYLFEIGENFNKMWEVRVLGFGKCVLIVLW